MRGDFRCLVREARDRKPSHAAEDPEGQEEEVDWGELVPRLQAFYGGDPERWFNLPLWALTAYLKMLTPLKAEQQLLLIEAVAVPNMKPDAAGRLISRLGRQARREKPPSVAEQLMKAMPVVYEPTPKEPDGR